MSDAGDDLAGDGPRLRIGPLPEERLAALEAERDREQAAVGELEAALKDLLAMRAASNEQGRYRRSVALGFVLGLVGLVAGLYVLVLRSCC